MVVALDWEDTEAQRVEITKWLDCHATSMAVVMPADLSNPDLGKSFHGVERYLGTDIVRAVASSQPGITETVAVPRRFELQPTAKSAVKQALRRDCEARGDPADLVHVGEVAAWLETRLIGATTSTLPGT